ncbi:MAG TPA: xanthine phosphoribosyltransferase [Acidimicrobiia bacterium]|nr:xanthine phosphoribosyltransferase [Acidimicrobiia bacterium]
MSSPATTPGAAALERAVRERGRVEGSLVKVDDFLNHQVDPALLDLIGQDIADRWEGEHIDLVVTAEASGIPPALTVARSLGVPMLYAKKYLRTTTERPSYVREVASPTKGTEYRVEITRRLLPGGRRVLVVDDFLSGGRTAEALGEIIEEAGCSVVGFAFVIEKSFVEGRSRLLDRGWRVDSLLRVTSLEGGLGLDTARFVPEHRDGPG